MSESNTLFPRRPLLLGEALAKHVHKPFQYKYDDRNAVVNTTGALLKTIYGDTSYSSYCKLSRDFELKNCLDIVVAEGDFFKHIVAATAFLEKQLHDAVDYLPSKHQEISCKADMPVKKQVLPLFYGRRVFFLGGPNVVFFERMLEEKNLKFSRKNRNEVLVVNNISKGKEDPKIADINVAFSIVTLYHPSKHWQRQYTSEELQELGELFRESAQNWRVDWDYEKGELFHNQLLEE